MNSAESTWAAALFKAAKETGLLARTADDLSQCVEAIRSRGSCFFSPVVPAERKTALLREAWEGAVCELVLEFLCLMAQRRAMRLLPGTCRQFARLAEKELGEIKVTLRIPFPPGQALLDRLRDRLAAMGMFSEKDKDGVSFDVVSDKSLLGGFTAEYDGKLLDRSLRSRIAQAEGISF